MTTDTSPRWCTSSHSDNGGQCVEVATNLVTLHGTVPVRDSKNVGGPVLSFPAESFASFVSVLKEGSWVR
ncbi:DUF397 domain-containing protein [Streptomyces sp. NPDC091281]|uniref:DUF397 domain-containing protein n=1 Tax=Streptomyces sp. NPDC091281 TaxID=3365985 RepID=UPI0037FF6A3C